MQGLYFNGKNAMLVSDLSIPEPLQHESLVRISISAICNTDKEIIRGYKPEFTGVLGHEFVGVVIKSGDQNLIGKRVVGELNEGCGECLYCKTIREHHCENRKCIGIAGRDGCFAQYMTIATRLLHVVPDRIADEHAVFAEPLAAALEISDQNHIRPSEEICVIGDGRLSFMITQVLSLTGAEVTVLGKHDEKLQYFKKFAKTEIETERKFDVVVDATGSSKGIEQAINHVRSKGKIIIKSTYEGNANVDLSKVVVNELTVVGSRCGPFEPAIRLLDRGLIMIPKIELYKLSEWELAFASKAFKAGFDFR